MASEDKNHFLPALVSCLSAITGNWRFYDENDGSDKNSLNSTYLVKGFKALKQELSTVRYGAESV